MSASENTALWGYRRVRDYFVIFGMMLPLTNMSPFTFTQAAACPQRHQNPTIIRIVFALIKPTQACSYPCITLTQAVRESVVKQAGLRCMGVASVISCRGEKLPCASIS